MTTSLDSLSVSAPPRLATPRTLSLATYGPQVDAVMEALRLPPLPWQSMVNQVACEVREDGSWRYPTVILTVPRQAGKTALLGGQLVHRMMTFPDLRAWYTAQTGIAAVDAFNEWIGVLNSCLPDHFTFRKSQGSQTITLPERNSAVRIFPPTPDSLHGRQSDIVVLDECWAHDEDKGAALLQAIIPTQATRKMRQTWLVSTAGDDTSDWWRSWVDKGRASLEDPDSTIAYFEWSAAEDTDPNDEAAWPTFHPAYGLTQSEESFRIALEQLGSQQFRRAYLNLWPPSSGSWRIEWDACVTNERLTDNAGVVFAADCDPWHRHAAIVAAGHIDNKAFVEIVDYREGVDWLPERIVQLASKHYGQVAIARSGPLGYMVPDLEMTGNAVRALTTYEYGDAVSRFQTATVAHHIAHPGDPRMDAAVANVKDATLERPVWRRRDQRIDISPVVAAALAVFTLETNQAPQVF